MGRKKFTPAFERGIGKYEKEILKAVMEAFGEEEWERARFKRVFRKPLKTEEVTIAGVKIKIREGVGIDLSYSDKLFPELFYFIRTSIKGKGYYYETFATLGIIQSDRVNEYIEQFKKSIKTLPLEDYRKEILAKTVVKYLRTTFDIRVDETISFTTGRKKTLITLEIDAPIQKFRKGLLTEDVLMRFIEFLKFLKRLEMVMRI